MVRPAKSIITRTGHITKEEIQVRKETEEKLKGATNNIFPPRHLNARQKKIFNYIVEELKASEILGNLDIYILSTCAIAIDRIQQIEKEINKDINKLLDKNLMAAKDKYSKEFFRCCNELSISPASRAKLGNINLDAKKKAEDPLLKVLSGSDVNE